MSFSDKWTWLVALVIWLREIQHARKLKREVDEAYESGRRDERNGWRRVT